MSNIAKRGFASMDVVKRKEIQSKGGKSTSSKINHMADIGRKGGIASGKIRRVKS